MPLAQLRVCGILYDGPRPMSALSRELGVSLSAMTQIADRLERARLVNRVAEGADRRIRCLQLTERGQKLMRSREDARNRRVLAVLEQFVSRGEERGARRPGDLGRGMCLGQAGREAKRACAAANLPVKVLS